MGKDLIARIKDILSSDTNDANAVKRDLVDAATKIEAIIDEIKKFFKPEEKRGVIVNAATKVQATAQKIKDLIARIKDILSSDSSDATVVKRDLVDVATKVEATVQKVKDLIARIKDILSSDSSDATEEKRDLVDAATKIEAIL